MLDVWLALLSVLQSCSMPPNIWTAMLSVLQRCAMPPKFGQALLPVQPSRAAPLTELPRSLTPRSPPLEAPCHLHRKTCTQLAIGAVCQHVCMSS